MSKKKVRVSVQTTNNTQNTGQWLEHWLENYIRPSIRQSTYEIYRGYLDNHLLPQLGDIPLKELNSTDIQLFLRHLQLHGNQKSPNHGLASTTVIAIRTLLKSALEHAVQEDLITKNPARNTKAPKWEKQEMNVLSQEEVAQFLRKTANCRYYAAYVLTLTTGARRGEILGLSWKSVYLGIPWESLDKQLPWQKIAELPMWDTEALKTLLKRRRIRLRPDPYITITQQLSDLRSGPQLTLPKTRRSQRIIGIPMETALILLFHRSNQRMEQELFGAAYNAEQLVFCDKGGKMLEPRYFTRIFQRDMNNCGLRSIRFHDLRHTVATILLEDGKAINTVQEILGHYNPSFTASQYGHVTTRMKQEATATLGQVLKKARSAD